MVEPPTVQQRPIQIHSTDENVPLATLLNRHSGAVARRVLAGGGVVILALGGGSAIGQIPGVGNESRGEQTLTRGPVHEAFAGIVSYNPEPGLIVKKIPPDAINELPPDVRPEGDNITWIPGYWAWDDGLNDFLWISGTWRALPPGREWISGYWAAAAQGHQWTSGYWVWTPRGYIFVDGFWDYSVARRGVLFALQLSSQHWINEDAMT